MNKAILGRVGVQTWEQGQTGVSTIEISVDFTGGHGVFQTFNTHTQKIVGTASPRARVLPIALQSSKDFILACPQLC